MICGIGETWARRRVTHGFDARNLLTYDARPMSGSLHAWYSLRELESLADRGVTLSGELDVGKLTRLKSLLHSDSGSVRATLRFRQRGDGWLASQLDYQAEVELVCQRCLEPFRHELAQSVNVVVADSDSLPATVPEGFEPFEVAGWPVTARRARRGRAHCRDSAGAEARASRGLW